MYCIKCGTKLSDEALFCHKCGTKVISEVEAPKKTSENAVLAKTSGNLKFKLYGRELVYSEEIIEFNTIQKPFAQLAYQCRQSYRDYYINSVHSISDLAASTKKVEEYMRKSVELGVKILMRYDIDYIGVDELAERILDYVDVSSIFAEVLSKGQEAQQMREKMEFDRSIKKLSRGRWSGGGFGISGAIKGAISAGIMNTASDALYGIGDSIAEAKDRKKIEEFSNGVIKDSRIVLSIYDGIYSCCYGVLFCVTDILVKEGYISAWDIDIDLDIENGRLRNYLGMYKSDHNVKEKLMGVLLNCIQANPFEVSYYITIYPFLDDVRGLEELTRYWGLDDIVRNGTNGIRYTVISNAKNCECKEKKDIDKVNKIVSALKQKEKHDPWYNKQELLIQISRLNRLKDDVIKKNAEEKNRLERGAQKVAELSKSNEIYENDEVVADISTTNDTDDVCQLNEDDFYINYSSKLLNLNLFTKTEVDKDAFYTFSSGDKFWTSRNISSESSRDEVISNYGKAHQHRKIDRANIDEETILKLSPSFDVYMQNIKIIEAVTCDEYFYEDQHKKGTICFYYNQKNKLILLAFIVEGKKKKQ